MCEEAQHSIVNQWLLWEQAEHIGRDYEMCNNAVPSYVMAYDSQSNI